jgi:hypothetical protein
MFTIHPTVMLMSLLAESTEHMVGTLPVDRIERDKVGVLWVES